MEEPNVIWPDLRFIRRIAIRRMRLSFAARCFCCDATECRYESSADGVSSKPGRTELCVVSNRLTLWESYGVDDG